MILDIEENPFSYESIIVGKSNNDLKNLYTLLVNNKEISFSEDSKYDFHTRSEDSYCPKTAEVESIIKDMQLAYFKIIGEKISFVECWGHIHEKNMSTRLHSHRPNYVSGVFYVSAPKGSGSIVFPRRNLSPRFREFSWKMGYNLRDFIYEPKEGMFLLFPGYLEHYVTRNKSENLRISISFNFCLENTFSSFNKFTYF